MYPSITHIFSQRDRSALAEHIESTAAQSFSPFWFVGWSGEIEASLLDAVFSARATYGGKENGVRRLISRWREHRGIDRLDDLTALTTFADRPDDLAEILGNRQRVAGNSTTKAQAAIEIATVLVGFGVHSAEQLYDVDDQRAAVTAIAGVGPKTWEGIFYMCGLQTLDAYRLVTSFVSQALGRTVDGDLALWLLDIHSRSIGVEYHALEHAIWRYQRRIGPAAPRHSLSEAG